MAHVGNKSNVTITGPVEGGAFGWPFGCPMEDLSARGYRMAEFFFEGEARSYRARPETVCGRDGLWQTEPHETAPFKTRAYIVCPKDKATFNGVVIANWQNVTANIDLGWPSGDEIFRGYAWVGITAQKIGVDGVPGLTKGLAAWDPERYGSLMHPGDHFSNDIFAQIARCFGPERPRSALDPLGGLKPRKIIATGGSQSAIRLGSYINAAHAHDRLFDGFFLSVHWGMCSPLEDVSLRRQFKPIGGGLYAASCKINDQVGVPILVLTSESEVFHNYPVRQPDTALFRHWEMAGTTHADPDLSDGLGAIMERDGLTITLSAPGRNQVRWEYVKDAALRHVVAWADQGITPPRFPRIEVDGKEAPRIRRDKFGNALGGMRLPDLEVPTGSHRGTNELDPVQALSGQTIVFDRKERDALYPTAAAYYAAWDRAVDALAAAGGVLQEDVAALKARARRIGRWGGQSN